MATTNGVLDGKRAIRHAVCLFSGESMTRNLPETSSCYAPAVDRVAPTTVRHRPRSLRLGSLVCGVLALVLFADASQAGASYVYCRAMDAVLRHACCEHHDAARDPQCPALQRDADCCQTRRVQALAPSTRPVRSDDVRVAPMLAWVLPAFTAGPLAAADSCSSTDARMRTGPPPTRARAQLMVFQV